MSNPPPRTLHDVILTGANMLMRCERCYYWRSLDPEKLLQTRLRKGHSILIEDIVRVATCGCCYHRGRVTFALTKRPAVGDIARARGIDRSNWWKDEFACPS